MDELPKRNISASSTWYKDITTLVYIIKSHCLRMRIHLNNLCYCIKVLGVRYYQKSHQKQTHLCN